MDIYNPQSISDAVRLLKEYRNGLDKVLNEFLRSIAEYGVRLERKFISEQVTEYSTGELAQSIQVVLGEKKNTFIIRVNAEYALFVEYGTGIEGASNPHPEPLDGWEYDVNEHGEAGWVYRKNGKYFWTAGQVGKRFVWDTYMELELIADKVSGR